MIQNIGASFLGVNTTALSGAIDVIVVQQVFETIICKVRLVEPNKKTRCPLSATEHVVFENLLDDIGSMTCSLESSYRPRDHSIETPIVS